MERLFAKIDAEPARKPAVMPGFAVGLGELLAAFSPRVRAFAAIAAVLAILLQAGVITGMILENSTYQSAGELTGSPAVNGDLILIGFAPQATQEDVTKFLEANKLQITSGPTEGAYKVRVAVMEPSKVNITEIITKLLDDKIVSYAAKTH